MYFSHLLVLVFLAAYFCGAFFSKKKIKKTKDGRDDRKVPQILPAKSAMHTYERSFAIRINLPNPPTIIRMLCNLSRKMKSSEFTNQSSRYAVIVDGTDAW